MNELRRACPFFASSFFAFSSPCRRSARSQYLEQGELRDVGVRVRAGQRELPEMEEEVAFQDMKSCAQADAGVGPRLADTIQGHFPVGGRVEKPGVVTVISRVSSVPSIGQCSGQIFLELLSRVVSVRHPTRARDAIASSTRSGEIRLRHTRS